LEQVLLSAIHEAAALFQVLRLEPSAEDPTYLQVRTLDDLARHRRSADPSDDITLIVLRRTAT
jgi:hypothetical protein